MPEQPRPLTVSELMMLARRALEPLEVTVVGEVTEFTDRSGYKAVYFTLSDPDAVLPCLVWRDAYERSDCPLRCGMLVEARGAMTVYAPKGRMQFQVRSLAPAGEGFLRMQVSALARRLEAEGLMSRDRKRPLPEYPERIGLVTSPRGKAVHDVVRTLWRRYPAAELVFAGVAVEGADAPASIVSGLETVGRAGVDVVILARGGGSYEDLMPFNTEEVARAVAASPAPVVTGIGHEPDTSIADMVADVRASTPTGAAEAATPSCDEVTARLVAMERALGRGLQHVVIGLEHRLALAERSPVLADARGWLSVRAQSVDLAAEDLSTAGRRLVTASRTRLGAAASTLAAAAPSVTRAPSRRLATAAASLDALSPLAVLARGYAVVYGEAGAVLTDASSVAAGHLTVTRLAHGTLRSRVEEIEP